MIPSYNLDDPIDTLSFFNNCKNLQLSAYTSQQFMLEKVSQKDDEPIKHKIVVATTQGCFKRFLAYLKIWKSSDRRLRNVARATLEHLEHHVDKMDLNKLSPENLQTLHKTLTVLQYRLHLRFIPKQRQWKKVEAFGNRWQALVDKVTIIKKTAFENDFEAKKTQCKAEQIVQDSKKKAIKIVADAEIKATWKVDTLISNARNSIKVKKAEAINQATRLETEAKNTMASAETLRKKTKDAISNSRIEINEQLKVLYKQIESNREISAEIRVEAEIILAEIELKKKEAVDNFPVKLTSLEQNLKLLKTKMLSRLASDFKSKDLSIVCADGVVHFHSFLLRGIEYFDRSLRNFFANNFGEPLPKTFKNSYLDYSTEGESKEAALIEADNKIESAKSTDSSWRVTKFVLSFFKTSNLQSSTPSEFTNKFLQQDFRQFPSRSLQMLHDFVYNTINEDNAEEFLKFQECFSTQDLLWLYKLSEMLCWERGKLFSFGLIEKRCLANGSEQISTLLTFYEEVSFDFDLEMKLIDIMPKTSTHHLNLFHNVSEAEQRKLLTYLEHSSKQGSLAANFKLSFFLRCELCFMEKNIKLGLAILEKINIYPPAQAILSRYQLETEDKEGVIKKLSELADEPWNIVTAQFILAEYYRVKSKKEKSDQDAQEALRFYNLAAKQGDPAAQFFLALGYRDGKIANTTVPNAKDPKKALEFFRKGDAQGYAMATIELGRIFQLGLCGIKADLKQGFEFFSKAAFQGEPLGYYNAGICLSNGEGVSKNNEEALINFQSAIHSGNNNPSFDSKRGNAYYFLGNCFELRDNRSIANLENFAENYQKAIILGHKSAKVAFIRIAIELGDKYQESKSNPNIQKSLKWYEAAAALGSEDAKKKIKSFDLQIY